jgi:tyrosinase
MLSTSHICSDCITTTGESCIYCKGYDSGYSGCQQCEEYTSLIYDTKCGIFVCRDNCITKKPTLEPTFKPTELPTKVPTPDTIYTPSPTVKPNICYNTPSPTFNNYPTEPTIPTTPAPTTDECKRHRKPWHKLTNAERMLYINGWLYLHQNGQIPTELSNIHATSYNSAQAHGGSGFLPWHRYFLWEIESLIRNIGPEYECFSLPYWDWGHDALNSGSSIIYSSGLSQQSPTFGDCVDNNYFDENSYGTPTNCLVRNTYTSTQLFSSGFKQSTMLLGDIVNNPLFENYRPVLESSHNSPHGRVGGNMATYRSPDDPLFYLHHCYIDFNYAIWQDCHNYDLINKNNLDGNNAAYFGVDNSLPASEVDLDSELRFSGLYGTSWGVINGLGFNPTVRDMHDITDWNIIYDIGDFWDEAGVDDQLYCNNNMNNNWFTGISLTDDINYYNGDYSGNSDYITYNLPEYIEPGYSYPITDCTNYDYRTCTSAIDPVYGENGLVNYGFCDCSEIDYGTCKYCGNNDYIGCNECNYGYFKKTNGHQCVSCDNFVGYGCDICQDYIGCQRCMDGYKLIYDSVCDLWKCERNNELCPKEYLYKQRQYINTLDYLDDECKRQYMDDVVCEYSVRNLLDSGVISERCVIPDYFEGCTDDEEQYITLDYLLQKPGVADTECLQEIRRDMYDWLELNGQLMDLCNGEYDPKC